MTICTERGQCILGNVFGGQFDASEAGKIVGECWLELPYHYAGLHLDAFVVMPNHVHGLLIFEDAVGAGLRPAPTKIKRRSLPEVVRALKTFSARRINEVRRTQGDAVWQRGYFERIIRGENAMRTVRGYIANNPVNWETDTENPLPLQRARRVSELSLKQLW